MTLVPEAEASFQVVPVRELLGEEAESLRLRLVAGELGLDREIAHPRVQKTALAVTGFVESIHPRRVQVYGASEAAYVGTLSKRKRKQIFKRLCEAPVSCFVVTKGLEPAPELLESAAENDVPVCTTPLQSSELIDRLQRLLEVKLAPRTTVHGNLLDLYGLGVLILGESGIGKSECALDLVTRGHRLVSDDVVEIHRGAAQVLVGAGPDLTRYHMEIRGVGLINIKDLFGISAIRAEKEVQLLIVLEQWQEGRAYDRLGLEEESLQILDIRLPMLRMPVAPGRNIANLIEVAARNHLLKARGYHAARTLVERLDGELRKR